MNDETEEFYATDHMSKDIYEQRIDEHMEILEKAYLQREWNAALKEIYAIRHSLEMLVEKRHVTPRKVRGDCQ